MTVTITSSNRVELVSGKDVQFNAPPVPSITTDDIYNPNRPVLTLTKLLQGVSAVEMVGASDLDASVIGNTVLYTVPLRQTFIPTAVIFILTDIIGSGSAPSVNVGYAGAFRQLIDSDRVPGLFDSLNDPEHALSITDLATTAGHSGADFQYINEGMTVTVRVDTPATFSVYSLKCLLWGFLAGIASPSAIPTSTYGRGGYGRDEYGVW